MTDREKRKQLEKKLRRQNFNATEEEILEKREAYLEKHYGKLGHRSLPLPQKRGNWKRPLTMKILEEQVLAGQDRGNFLADAIGFSLMFLAIGGLMLACCFFGYFHFGLFLVGLMFCAFGIMGIKAIPEQQRENKQVITMIQKGEFRILSYQVLDMSHEDESSASDDNADWHYYLHLGQPGQKKPWLYDCGIGFYELVREGDTVHLVFLIGNKEPIFAFREENWVPDAQIRAYMRNTDA